MAPGRPAPEHRIDARDTTSVLELDETRCYETDQTDEKPSVCPVAGTAERIQQTYDIFEGTEQIQQLVIVRAISGLRIE
jgi:hypothetical protein